MERPETPECDRLAAIADQSQQIGEFVDWLAGEGLHVAEWVRRHECDHPTPCRRGMHDLIEPYLVPLAGSTEALLARYFGIDLAKIDREKRAVLAWIREQHNAVDQEAFG